MKQRKENPCRVLLSIMLMILLTACNHDSIAYHPVAIRAPESTKEWLRNRNLDDEKNAKIFMETQLILNSCQAPDEVKQHYVAGFPKTETWVWFKQIGDLNKKLER